MEKPRRVWVDVTDLLLGEALPMLSALGSIESIMPVWNFGHRDWRVTMTNHDWPPGPEGPAQVTVSVSTEAMSVTRKMEIALP